MQVGPYRTLDELGRGGMGVVYRAEDAAGQVVALKLLLPQRAAQPRVRQRFLHELRSLSKLRHPHLVRLLAAGEHEGAPWLALELVAGQSLEERLRQGPLGVAEARRLVGQLASALAYLHDCGVIHRDLKPDNVLLRGDDALLTDFGLVLDNEDVERSRLSATGVFLGTPGYWAPEQARGEKHEQGPHTDLYGLGAVLYACLLGRPPVVAQSLAEYLQTRRFERIELPHLARPEVPEWLSLLCLECLDPDPARRPASAHEVARRLHRGEGPLPAEPSNRRLGWILLGALLLAAGSAVLAGSMLLGGKPTESAERTPALEPEPRETTPPELKRIEALLAADAEQAIAEVQAYLEVHPDSALGHVLLARALFDAERVSSAHDAVERALGLDPNSAWAHYLRGRLRSDEGDTAAALDDLRRAQELDPELVAPWVVAAQLLATNGSYADALPLFERALELAPDDTRVLRYRGLALLSLGRHAEALASLEAVLERDPGDFLASANRALALFELERLPEALAAASDGLELRPRDLSLLRLRGSILLELQRPAEALESYGLALAESPADAESLGARAECYFRLGRSAEALADYRAVTALEPSASAWHNQGQCLLRLRRLPEALVAFDEALALDPDFPPALRMRGGVRASTGDPRGALADFDRLLARIPDDAGTLVLRAQAHSLLGSFERALDDHLRAAELAPENLDNLQARAQILFRLGRYEVAAADCAAVLAARPDDLPTLNLRAMLAIARGDREDLVRAATRAGALGRGSPLAWETALLPCEVRADYEGALAELGRTLASVPSAPPAWLHRLRGRCQLCLGNTAQALEEFVRARERAATADERAECATWEALAHALAGDLPAAQASAELARSVLAGTPDAWAPALWCAGFGDREALSRLEGRIPRDLLGVDPALSALGRGAFPELETAFDGCPGPYERAQVACFLGLAAERRGELDAARACYRIAAAYPDRGTPTTVWGELRLAQLER